MSDESLDAYALLSKPTAEITDDDALKIITDLRARRAAYIRTGKPDKPKKERAVTAKLSADEKARNTAALMAQLKMPGLEPKA